MRRTPFLLAFLAGLLATGAARAAEPGVPTTPPEASGVPPSDVRALALAGELSNPSCDGCAGVLLGGSLLLRRGLLEGGALFQSGGQLFGYQLTSGAAMGGIGWRTSFGLRLDALAELGIDGYQGVGTGLFSSDPGVSGGLPFAGVRGGASYAFLRRASVHPEIGVWGFAEDDLGRTIATSSYPRPTAQGREEPPGPIVTPHVIGDSRVGALLALGLTFDTGR